jgi:GTP:adenosylcobinamide-phosphate guanylyltransferase
MADQERAYPLALGDADQRFTFGLVHDVAEVLVSHGFPRLVVGGDLVELQQALFRFLYRDPEVPS